MEKEDLKNIKENVKRFLELTGNYSKIQTEQQTYLKEVTEALKEIKKAVKVSSSKELGRVKTGIEKFLEQKKLDTKSEYLQEAVESLKEIREVIEFLPLEQLEKLNTSVEKLSLQLQKILEQDIKIEHSFDSIIRKLKKKEEIKFPIIQRVITQKRLEELLEEVSGKVGRIKLEKQDLDLSKYQTPQSYLAVRLTDGRKFYEALGEMVTISKNFLPGVAQEITLNAVKNAVELLDNTVLADRLQVDVITEPGATSPQVHNVTLSGAATEYGLTLYNTKKYTFKCRTSYDLRLAFVSGKSGTNYITIPAGTAYWEDSIIPSSLNLYFQQPTVSGTIAEILAWS